MLRFDILVRNAILPACFVLLPMAVGAQVPEPFHTAPPLVMQASWEAHAFLGVGVTEIDSERSKALKLKEERGVEITSVEPESAAGKAGLKEGDVVRVKVLEVDRQGRVRLSMRNVDAA